MASVFQPMMTRKSAYHILKDVFLMPDTVIQAYKASLERDFLLPHATDLLNLKIGFSKIDLIQFMKKSFPEFADAKIFVSKTMLYIQDIYTKRNDKVFLNQENLYGWLVSTDYEINGKPMNYFFVLNETKIIKSKVQAGTALKGLIEIEEI